jgi:hypothetical protein
MFFDDQFFSWSLGDSPYDSIYIISCLQTILGKKILSQSSNSYTVSCSFFTLNLTIKEMHKLTRNLTNLLNHDLDFIIGDLNFIAEFALYMYNAILNLCCTILWCTSLQIMREKLCIGVVYLVCLEVMLFSMS